jgi:hypothetical protein
MNPRERRTIPYTQLPDSEPGSVLAEEWDVYRREVGRLLSEGHEGRFVLIKGSDIIGLYDTWQEARAESVRRYLLGPSLTKQILANEPLLSVRRYA